MHSKSSRSLLVSFLVKGKSLSTPLKGNEWTTPYTANVEGDVMNSAVRILPLSSGNDLVGERIEIKETCFL